MARDSTEKDGGMVGKVCSCFLRRSVGCVPPGHRRQNQMAWIDDRELWILVERRHVDYDQDIDRVPPSHEYGLPSCAWDGCTLKLFVHELPVV